MKNLNKNFVKNKYIFALAAIFLIAVFLRAYNFDDWLRFSMDQSRDAMLISNITEGKTSLPLLGPIAGGTNFTLGPAYYYFSIISAMLFGDTAKSMAYPSLVFSILAVPLMYFFLREYFSKNISLALMWLMTISYFAVINSRFSSNPNLTPFFVLLFLYAMTKISNCEKNKPILKWILLLGLALGIAVQLHVTLLLALPVIAIIFLYYQYKKEVVDWRKILVVVSVALFLNVTQIYSEIVTKASNSRAFIAGLTEKGGEDSNISNNFGKLAICQIKANATILSSIPATEECSDGFDIASKGKKVFEDVKPKELRKAIFYSNIVFSIIFSLIGYGLLAYFLRKEKDEKKKNFLKIVALYNAVALLVLIPVVSYLNTNYFIILIPIPFILLGLILQFLNSKSKYLKYVSILLITVLSGFSFMALKNGYEYYSQGLDNNRENTNLGHVEKISKFIIENSKDQEVIFTGRKAYVERYERPLNYFVTRSGLDFQFVDFDDLDELKTETNFVFYIQNAGGKLEHDNREVVAKKNFGAMDIYILKK